MKLNNLYNINENISPDAENVHEIKTWISKNCYDINTDNYKIMYSDVAKYFSIDDNGTINGESIDIRTDVETLPYKIREFTRFALLGTNLKSCVNFPEIYTARGIPVYDLSYVHVLDFSDMPSMIQHLKLFRTNNLSIDRIFSKPSLKLHAIHFTRSNSEDICDFSKYKNINVKNCAIDLHENRISNLSDVLYLEHNRLAVLEFKLLHAQYYHTDKIKAMNKILSKYLDNYNRKNYIMDMTVEIMDSDLEDVL